MAKSKRRKRTSAVGNPKRTRGTAAASPETVSFSPPLGKTGETTAEAARPTVVLSETAEVKDSPVLPDTTSETPPADSSVVPLDAPDRPEAAAAESEMILELLAFRLADEEYTIDILMIKEIIRSVEITSVPRTRPFIKGIISLRGMIIPVFDLRTRLGLTESLPDRATRIVVVVLEKGLIGLIADQVTEVVKVKSSQIEPPPTTGGGSLSGHLKGMARVNGRLLILLDLEKAITSE
ncbi:MAG: purine-binding chemotaxis protein CheW [Nitrospirae bacterium]|nr:purine-binding chemotaxis protein CheW [Nitrospirota bacterium]